MSIRKQAVLWLEKNFGERPTPLFTSKYYKPEESWPKKSVWWFHIPITAIEENSFGHISLICEAVPNENKFHYLKVPVAFFIDHLNKFHVVKDNISIYLSTDPKRFLVEERGTGALDFSPFIVK